MSVSIAVVQRKGGVGKTTISTHIAAGWAIKGYRVCLIDNDSQGDAARLMGMTPRDGLYNWLAEGKPLVNPDNPSESVLMPVPVSAYAPEGETPSGALMLMPSSSRTSAIAAVTDNPFLYAERMEELYNLFDVIVLDTAPTISAFDAYVYLASDYFVYVTECEALSLAGLREGMAQVTRFSKHRVSNGLGAESRVLGVVPNKMRPQTAAHRTNLEMAAAEYGSLIWTPIIQRTKWTEASSLGELIYRYAPHNGEAKDAWAIVDRAEKEMLNVVS